MRLHLCVSRFKHLELQNSYLLNKLLNYSLERGKIHMHELDTDFLKSLLSLPSSC
jgi:hypothetical protein